MTESTESRKHPFRFSLEINEGYLEVWVVGPEWQGKMLDRGLAFYDYSDWEWLKKNILESIDEVESRMKELSPIYRKLRWEGIRQGVFSPPFYMRFVIQNTQLERR